jgi:hypothetical protein
MVTLLSGEPGFAAAFPPLVPAVTAGAAESEGEGVAAGAADEATGLSAGLD